MRDWSKAFLPASFKGVRFWVDEEGQDGGRRIAVQHVAYGETPITEDFGSRETVFPITAYLASDLADAEARRLSQALRSPGPGRLVLPMEGGMTAHAAEFRRSRQKDRGGFIAYDISFIKVGGAVAFAPSFDANGALSALASLTQAVVSALR
jgi:prophage DNA circulation protein